MQAVILGYLIYHTSAELSSSLMETGQHSLELLLFYASLDDLFIEPNLFVF